MVLPHCVHEASGGVIPGKPAVVQSILLLGSIIPEDNDWQEAIEGRMKHAKIAAGSKTLLEVRNSFFMV